MHIDPVSLPFPPSISLQLEDVEKNTLPQLAWRILKKEQTEATSDSLSSITNLHQIVDSRVHLSLEKVHNLFRSVVLLEKKEDLSQEYLSTCWDFARSELEKLYEKIINKN